MILPALVAKFLSAGAIAQAATGATVAVVAFTGVGVVGGLPDPVQDTFATVVANVTPLEVPTSEETTEEVTPEETVVEETDATETTETTDEAAVVDVQAWIETGPEGYDSFGEWVSLSASDPMLREALRAEGKTFGSVISKWAHDKGMDADDLAAEGVDLDTLDDEVTEPETVEDTPDAVVTETAPTQGTKVATTEDRGSRGNGNGGGKATGGNGNGRGNGKN